MFCSTEAGPCSKMYNVNILQMAVACPKGSSHPYLIHWLLHVYILHVASYSMAQNGYIDMCIEPLILLP